jgi:hypothetical protein
VPKRTARPPSTNDYTARLDLINKKWEPHRALGRGKRTENHRPSPKRPRPQTRGARKTPQNPARTSTPTRIPELLAEAKLTFLDTHQEALRRCEAAGADVTRELIFAIPDTTASVDDWIEATAQLPALVQAARAASLKRKKAHRASKDKPDTDTPRPGHAVEHGRKSPESPASTNIFMAGRGIDLTADESGDDTFTRQLKHRTKNASYLITNDLERLDAHTIRAIFYRAWVPFSHYEPRTAQEAAQALLAPTYTLEMDRNSLLSRPRRRKIKPVKNRAQLRKLWNYKLEFEAILCPAACAGHAADTRAFFDEDTGIFYRYEFSAAFEYLEELRYARARDRSNRALTATFNPQRYALLAAYPIDKDALDDSES